ncbi:hypothetical protein EV702DRAFT_1198122 [Suillus placidus]|uniref:Uncharacterized protein n=1 Tax=Suillus placidus TaxID=48579 RepID=A0A9P6ZTW7_9AGAM|nr:hypothetical protein EV702DRAFT_1198122 [Suillus placidus]
MTSFAVAMFWVPMMVLKHLKNIYVDGLVNGVDIKAFTDDFNAQAKSQTTMASVIMAVNASILAIPGLGAQIATKTLCSISFILSVYCILGLAFSILGFLAGIFTADFELPLFAKVACGLALIMGGSLILPLTVASFGPGLIRY